MKLCAFFKQLEEITSTVSINSFLQFAPFCLMSSVFVIRSSFVKRIRHLLFSVFVTDVPEQKKMWIATPYLLEVIRFQINWRKRRKITVCGVRFWKPAVSTKWGKPVDLPVKNDAQGVSTTPEMNVWELSHTMKPTQFTKKNMTILSLLWIVRMSFVG